jgi:hypothetical protein
VQYSAAGIALAASAKAIAEEPIASPQSNKRLYENETKEADVPVVGGGTLEHRSRETNPDTGGCN